MRSGRSTSTKEPVPVLRWLGSIKHVMSINVGIFSFLWADILLYVMKYANISSSSFANTTVFLLTLASNKIFLHSFRSLATVYQFLIPFPFKSSSALSNHLSLSLPIFLFPSILAVTNCFNILLLLILVICPYHLNISGSRCFTMSAPCRLSCISVFFLILQLSSSFTEPCIFLTKSFRIL